MMRIADKYAFHRAMEMIVSLLPNSVLTAQMLNDWVNIDNDVVKEALPGAIDTFIKDHKHNVQKLSRECLILWVYKLHKSDSVASKDPNMAIGIGPVRRLCDHIVLSAMQQVHTAASSPTEPPVTCISRALRTISNYAVLSYSTRKRLLSIADDGLWTELTHKNQTVIDKMASAKLREMINPDVLVEKVESALTGVIDPYALLIDIVCKLRDADKGGDLFSWTEWNEKKARLELMNNVNHMTLHSRKKRKLAEIQPNEQEKQKEGWCTIL
jgi:hypothetical protein